MGVSVFLGMISSCLKGSGLPLCLEEEGGGAGGAAGAGVGGARVT